MDLVLRALTPDDAEAVAALSDELGYPNTTETIRERLQGLFSTKDSAAWGVVMEGRLAGWIEASVERHLQSPACVVIGGLVVREDCRSRGIGERLCQQVEHWAQSKRIHTVRVRSQIAREAAHRFYRNKGFATVKTSLVFEKKLTPAGH